MTELLTAAEVGKRLKIKEARVWDLTRERKFPFAILIGQRQYRYSAEGLQRYIESGGNYVTEGEKCAA